MKYTFLILVAVCFGRLHAQVVNDDIEKAIPLERGVTHSSDTRKCSVQWNCVDESLTGKCIKFHNDQWFTYAATKTETVFINIHGQSCRDTRGVQLVVIDGIPCDLPSYKILACVSLATQDDIHVEIPVAAEREYLINIDGYQRDFCRFKLSVDDHPKGFPAQPNIIVPYQTTLNGRIAGISWTVPDSMASRIREFEIHRREADEFRSSLRTRVSLERNAAGVPVTDYAFVDTLFRHLDHHYKLVAVDREGRKWLAADVDFATNRRDDVPGRTQLMIPLKFWKDVPVSVRVWDAAHTVLLKQQEFPAGSRKSDEVSVELDTPTDKSATEVLIEVVNLKTNQKNLLHYRLE